MYVQLYISASQVTHRLSEVGLRLFYVVLCLRLAIAIRRLELNFWGHAPEANEMDILELYTQDPSGEIHVNHCGRIYFYNSCFGLSKVF